MNEENSLNLNNYAHQDAFFDVNGYSDHPPQDFSYINDYHNNYERFGDNEIPFQEGLQDSQVSGIRNYQDFIQRQPPTSYPQPRFRNDHQERRTDDIFEFQNTERDQFINDQQYQQQQSTHYYLDSSNTLGYNNNLNQKDNQSTIEQIPLQHNLERTNPSGSSALSIHSQEISSSGYGGYASSHSSNGSSLDEELKSSNNETSASIRKDSAKKRDKKSLRKQGQALPLYTEQDLENDLENEVNRNDVIIKQNQELQQLKEQALNKKELQQKRNRITAQQSRDRKKLEHEYMRKRLIHLENQLIQINKVVNGKDRICPTCRNQFLMIDQEQITRVQKGKKGNNSGRQSSLQSSGLSLPFKTFGSGVMALALVALVSVIAIIGSQSLMTQQLNDNLQALPMKGQARNLFQVPNPNSLISIEDFNHYNEQSEYFKYGQHLKEIFEQSQGSEMEAINMINKSYPLVVPAESQSNSTQLMLNPEYLDQVRINAMMQTAYKKFIHEISRKGENNGKNLPYPFYFDQDDASRPIQRKFLNENKPNKTTVNSLNSEKKVDSRYITDLVERSDPLKIDQKIICLDTYSLVFNSDSQLTYDRMIQLKEGEDFQIFFPISRQNVINSENDEMNSSYAGQMIVTARIKDVIHVYNSQPVPLQQV